MTKLVEAVREKPMSDRQQKRVDVDGLIQRFHFLGGVQMFGFMPDYATNEDGSETKITILVEDENAAKVASEFRACGFVASIS